MTLFENIMFVGWLYSCVFATCAGIDTRKQKQKLKELEEKINKFDKR